jgi:phthalate 4,5-dioxygenase
MGRLMREYWIPSLLSTELQTPDCAPVRVMLLGERLIAFRDSLGRPGLVAEACPHRGASLFYARNEDCGLRCMYHGWKFDVTGRCVDTPTEPADSTLKEKVVARAYPCIERGGIVWAYLGPREVPPPLPELEPNLDETCGQVDATMVENNWLQALEGDVDLAHIPFLHAENLRALAAVHEGAPSGGAAAAHARFGAAPTSSIEVAGTPAGFAFAQSSPTQGTSSRQVWAIGHFLFPFYATLPYGALDSCHWMVARVPMDDFRTMTFAMWKRGASMPPREVMFGESCYRPNTADWFGRFRLTSDTANDFGLDRERAREAGGPGIAGQAVQDAAITASMGPIVDRRREHLGRADVTIIQLRRKLLAALRDFDKAGAPAVDTPSVYRVKHGSLRVADGRDWMEDLHRYGGAGRSEIAAPSEAAFTTR